MRDRICKTDPCIPARALVRVGHLAACCTTANNQIFEGDGRVTTFSMHGANQAFPVQRQNSDYDVALRDDVDDAEYLRTLAMYIPGLLNRHRPELVFYQAGVDGLAADSLGRMALTRAGLSKRNHMVYRACLNNGVPLVVTLGGGYSRPIDPTVDAVRCPHAFFAAIARLHCTSSLPHRLHNTSSLP